MKKYLFFLLALVFTVLISDISFSQDAIPLPQKENKHKAPKLSATDVDGNVVQNSSLPVLVVLPNNGFFSNSARAPQGGRRFIRSIYLITAAELTASAFPPSAVTCVGWGYYAFTNGLQQGTATTLNVKIYLQLAPASEISILSKPSVWAGAIAGMTLITAPTQTMTIPLGPGPYNIDVPTNGAFSTVAGMGVYVAVETEVIGFVPCFAGSLNSVGAPSLFANANNPNTMGRFFQDGTVLCPPAGGGWNDTLSPTMNLTSTARPETRFCNSLVDIADMPNLWALGKSPFPWGWPDTVCVRVRRLVVDNNPISIRVRLVNIGAPFITKFDTTIQLQRSLSNPNPFDTIIAIQDLCYPFWKRDSIIAEILPIPGEQVPENNRQGRVREQTCDAYGWADILRPPDGGVGLTLPGDIVVCFRNNCPPSTPYPLACIDFCFNAAPLGGNIPYIVRVWSDNNGIPGAIIHQSAPQITPPGAASPQKVTYMLPVPINIPNGRFYVGIRQNTRAAAGGNPLTCYQSELPKKGTHFLSDSATANWFDFNTDGNAFTLLICPKTWVELHLKAYLEGFYNGTTMIPDTARVEVRSQTPPFQLVDQSTAVLDSNGFGIFKYCKVNCDSNYFFVVRHRNHIATWSWANPERFDVCGKTYDFTTGVNKAFGSNQVLVGGAAAIYTGDVNQDCVVDGSDCLLIDNDAANFVTGYVATDVDGNDFVDGNDALYCENNSFNFVTCIGP